MVDHLLYGRDKVRGLDVDLIEAAQLIMVRKEGAPRKAVGCPELRRNRKWVFHRLLRIVADDWHLRIQFLVMAITWSRRRACHDSDLPARSSQRVCLVQDAPVNPAVLRQHEG